MIAPASEAGNGGRERGYIQARLESIVEDMIEVKQNLRILVDWQRAIDARLAQLETNVSGLPDWKRDADRKLTQMEERHSRQAGWNLIYTTVAAAIAGFIGTRNTP